jgi:hypothetical protein
MVRAIRSISLPKEMDNIVDKNIEDFSDYVQNCIRKDFMNQEEIDKKIKKHEDEILELKNLKIQTSSKFKDSKEEEKYLKQMKEHAKMYGIQDALNNYNKKFKKNISFEKFKEMVEE